MTEAQESLLAGDDNIRRAARLLHAARRVLVLSGAGISAESGIPTFREAQTGLWAQYSPQDLATPKAFARDPARVSAWYRWRRSLIARGGVNAGHRAIAELAERRETWVATQNVDGLHTAAGNRDVAELHGNIWRQRCSGCGSLTTLAVAEATGEADDTCGSCSAWLRPDVVWFGEMLPLEAMTAARNALETSDCVLIVGTSNQVYPAAALVDAALGLPAPVIEVNPERTGISAKVDCHLADRASRALPALIAEFDAQADNR